MMVTDFHPIMKVEVEHHTMKFKHLNLVPQIEFTCRLIDSSECNDILSVSVPDEWVQINTMSHHVNNSDCSHHVDIPTITLTSTKLVTVSLKNGM
jgi:hypothetical protein